MKYVVRLDYASLLFAPGTIDLPRISSALTGDDDLLTWQPHAKPENVDARTPLSCPDGLYFRPDCGYDKAPHYLAISGCACEHFRSTLPALADIAYSTSPNTHFKRLDFNFDVRMSKKQWRAYLADVFVHQWDTRRTKIVLMGSGDASTVYVGARASEIYCRVYNKSLEDPDFRGLNPDGSPMIPDDDEYLIRYEIEFKYKTRMVGGRDASYDPSPLFGSYYGDPSALYAEISRVWQEKVDSVVLPAGFETAEFVTDLSVSNLPVWTLDNQIPERKRIIAQNTDFVQKDFWKKLRFSRRFAPYFPYYFCHPEWIADALRLARARFGFQGSVELVYTPPKFDDINDLSFDDLGEIPDFLFPNGEEYENITFDEGGFNNAVCADCRPRPTHEGHLSEKQ